MECFLYFRKIEIESPFISHTNINSQTHFSSLKMKKRNSHLRTKINLFVMLFYPNFLHQCFIYHFFQPQFLLHNRWITHIEDDIIVIYIVANYAVCLWDCIVARIGFVMRTCKCIVFKITLIHDAKANFIRYHSVWPKVLICCWNIPIKFEKWIPNLNQEIRKQNRLLTL